MQYRAHISIALNALIIWSKPTDRPRNSVGIEFQTVGPATEKARRPNVIRRQCGTVSWCWSADRSDGNDRSAVGIVASAVNCFKSLRVNISSTVQPLNSTNHLIHETIRCGSNGHVTDDVTWLLRMFPKISPSVLLFNCGMPVNF